MCLPRLFGRYAANHLGAIRQSFLHMERSLIMDWNRRPENFRRGLTVFPVNPWQRTFVSLWMRRFWIVSA
jgi:hypothetical protein